MMMEQAGIKPKGGGVGRTDTPKPPLTVAQDELLELITKPKVTKKVDTCECEKEKKKRGPRKPRTVCKAGYFEQSFFNTRKTQVSIIPCR